MPNPKTPEKGDKSPHPALSPTSTIRPQQSSLGVTGLATDNAPGPSDAAQYGVGLGYPRRTSVDSQSSYHANPDSHAYHSHHRGSVSGTDDDEHGSTPRNAAGSYFPSPGDARRPSEIRAQTPSGRPLPSPGLASMERGSSRPPRPRLNVGGAGAPISRSASRARLRKEEKLEDNDDDEVEFRDRGEDLIRRRQKERKRAKKERERRAAGVPPAEAGADDGDESAPPSAINESFQVPGPSRIAALSPIRPAMARAPSRTRGVSTSRASVHTVEPEVREFTPRERAESVRSFADGGDDDQPTDEEGTVEEHSHGEEDEDEDEDDDDSPGDEEVTVKDRQDAINIEHPFGLPIWKPALYRKSRSVTRNAESAVHSLPSAAGDLNLMPGNIAWVVLFGWWLSLFCGVVAFFVTAAEAVTGGHGGYARTIRGLAWYIFWPFGNFVEGEGAPEDDDDKEDSQPAGTDESSTGYGTMGSGDSRPRIATSSSGSTVRPDHDDHHHVPAGSSSQAPAVSFAPGVKAAVHSPGENTHLLFTSKEPTFRRQWNKRAKFFSGIFYWIGFVFVVAPILLIVCTLCWFLVFTVPMAKLTWELLNLLYYRPLEINFRRAPKIAVASASPEGSPEPGPTDPPTNGSESPNVVLKRARLKKGQVAPTAGPTSTVLLCVYRAVGLQYYKYTVGGVNIMFINLLPIVFFTIIDGMLILPAVEKAHEEGRHVSPFLNLIASQALIFLCGLASVIPLSYFIGMAVASISAQSSIGMGAVINATFGSIIEIVLYGIALTQGKGRLVEGSIVGSLLAGVLLMPGVSMISGAVKRKEQKFNAKSAGVTSTMLIMAIIGTLTPTLFYQTYGQFQINCRGCPDSIPGKDMDPKDTWRCDSCYYQHPEPTTDPFYQERVKPLMYSCAVILVFSYLIGLWFSLRTHASQIWQNPQQLMAKEEQLGAVKHLGRITPATIMNPTLGQGPNLGPRATSIKGAATPRSTMSPHKSPNKTVGSPEVSRRPDLDPEAGPRSSDTRGTPRAAPNAPLPAHTGYTPYLESLNNMKAPGGMEPLPNALTQEDLRRAVHTLASVGAFQPAVKKAPEEEEAHGGHEAPSWTRGVSAAVLLSCTLLYAIIAEVLVDVVDVVLQGSGIDEKVLGLTLFALVPNTTEFMNAVSFAMNGNIALSMEIGSAYALQVCLLQIPAMVAFSAFYDPAKLGDNVDTFTLIFPRWDVIAIILSIFLLTYTYIEARSNYHRGSMLVLAYVVLMLGFFFAPAPDDEVEGFDTFGLASLKRNVVFGAGLTKDVAWSLSLTLSKLWAR